jgi:hypothetical protein
MAMNDKRTTVEEVNNTLFEILKKIQSNKLYDEKFQDERYEKLINAIKGIGTDGVMGNSGKEENPSTKRNSTHTANRNTVKPVISNSSKILDSITEPFKNIVDDIKSTVESLKHPFSKTTIQRGRRRSGANRNNTLQEQETNIDSILKTGILPSISDIKKKWKTRVLNKNIVNAAKNSELIQGVRTTVIDSIKRGDLDPQNKEQLETFLDGLREGIIAEVAEAEKDPANDPKVLKNIKEYLEALKHPDFVDGLIDGIRKEIRGLKKDELKSKEAVIEESKKEETRFKTLIKTLKDGFKNKESTKENSGGGVFGGVFGGGKKGGGSSSSSGAPANTVGGMGALGSGIKGMLGRYALPIAGGVIATIAAGSLLSSLFGGSPVMASTNTNGGGIQNSMNGFTNGITNNAFNRNKFQSGIDPNGTNMPGVEAIPLQQFQSGMGNITPSQSSPYSPSSRGIDPNGTNMPGVEAIPLSQFQGGTVPRSSAFIGSFTPPSPQMPTIGPPGSRGHQGNGPMVVKDQTKILAAEAAIRKDQMEIAKLNSEISSYENLINSTNDPKMKETYANAKREAENKVGILQQNINANATTRNSAALGHPTNPPKLNPFQQQQSGGISPAGGAGAQTNSGKFGALDATMNNSRVKSENAAKSMQTNLSPEEDAAIKTAAAKHGIPLDEAYAVMQTESKFNPKAKGDLTEKQGPSYGMGQVSAAAAKEMGYTHADMLDVNKNSDAAIGYYAKQRAYVDKKTGGTMTAEQRAAAAYFSYNAGQGSLDKHLDKGRPLTGEQKSNLERYNKNREEIAALGYGTGPNYSVQVTAQPPSGITPSQQTPSQQTPPTKIAIGQNIAQLPPQLGQPIVKSQPQQTASPTTIVQNTSGKGGGGTTINNTYVTPPPLGDAIQALNAIAPWINKMKGSNA